MLIRRYISNRLLEYYQQPSHMVVGKIPGVGASVNSFMNNNNVGSSSSSNNAAVGGGYIDFRRLMGEWHWKVAQQNIYDQIHSKDKASKNNQDGGRWLTPVELFKPYYSNCVANFINDAYNENNNSNSNNQTSDDNDIKFDIIELGGGRGTNANHILSYLQSAHPNVYNNLRQYTIYDHSSSLIELQKEYTKQFYFNDDTIENEKEAKNERREGQHTEKLDFKRIDLIDVAEEKVRFASSSKILTIVIGFEILDNLPHDKIRVGSNNQGRFIEQGEISYSTGTTANRINEEEDDEEEDSKLIKEEIFKPLNDRLLSKIFPVVGSGSGGRLQKHVYSTQSSSISWIPTVACGIIQQIQKSRPNCCLVLGDFDWLPPPDINSNNTDKIDNEDSISTTSSPIIEEAEPSTWGYGEPLVTSMDGIDYECYLSSPKYCDILFPTDFDKLALFVDRSYNNNDSDEYHRQNNKYRVNVHKQSDFLQNFGPEQIQQTKSFFSPLVQYNPLLHDFGNCSILTVTNFNNNDKK